jgi:tRNA-splicing ligase RtcB
MDQKSGPAWAYAHPLTWATTIGAIAMNIPNVKFWTAGVPVEEEALHQIRNIASLPILAGPVAIMPDVHLGIGATVGSVIPTRRAIIPSAVGVDIGCGMCAVKTSLGARDLPDSLARIRSRIESMVPVGFDMHAKPLDTASEGQRGFALKRHMETIHRSYKKLSILDRLGKYDHARVWKQLGSLGGGNHFIEICLDEEQQVWVMLHSGSRNIGNTIGQVAISTARELALKHQVRLPDKDLAWLDEGSKEFNEYVEALTWAQDYAALNRDLMLHRIMQAVSGELRRDIGTTEHAVNCHHNYAAQEEHFGEKVWITRKGAVSAREGQLGIIPGSMGVKSYIVRGKGNAASYCSCSHGAGRRLSRKAAKRQYSHADLVRQTEGVECRKDNGVLDEIPSAYKDIDAVMAAQTDLVEVVHALKQVVCIKG